MADVSKYYVRFYAVDADGNKIEDIQNAKSAYPKESTITSKGTNYVILTGVDDSIGYRDKYYLTLPDTIKAISGTTDAKYSYNPLTITNDGKTVQVYAGNTIYWNTFSTTAYINVTLTVEKQAVKYSLTQTLENCTSDTADSTDLESGTELNISVTPNENYYFAKDTDLSYTMGDTSGYFSRKNRYSGTLSLTVTDNVTTNVKATAIPYYSITQNLTNCTSDFQDTTIDGLDAYTITLTANSNYDFSSKYPYYTMGDATTNFELSSDAKTATATITATDDIIINATANKATYKFTANLTNCSCNIADGTTLNAGDSYTVKLTANDDYFFNDVPTITISGVSYDFNLSDDKLTGEYTFIATANATVRSKASYTKINIKAVNTDDYCTNNFTDGAYKIGDTVSMTFSFVDYWFYGNVRFIGYDGADIESGLNATITPDENYKNVTISFIVPDYYSLGVNYSQISVRMQSYAGVKLEYAVLSYCTGTPKAGEYRQNVNIHMELKTDEYYKFTAENPPYYDISTIIESERSRYFDSYTDTTATNDLIVNAATASITLYSKVVTITVYGTATTESNIEQEYQFIHAYMPTNLQLYDLSGARFQSSVTSYSGSGTETTSTTTTNNIDYGQFILKLYKTYIPVTSTKTDTIKLAYLDTLVDAPLIENAIIHLNCGTIEIAEISGNNIDYEHTNAQVYLPYIGFFDIPIAQVMKHEITIRYTCNILDASCYVTIANENEVFASYTGTIKEEIPYTIMYNEKVAQEYIADAQITSAQTPFIRLTSNKPLDNALGIFGTDSYITDKIGNFKGYNVFSNIELVTNANMLYDEATLIKQALQTGVFLDD